MFLLTRLLDGIDGAYARATNQCTEFGGYLDIVVDFTVRNRFQHLCRYTV
jgi:phosphatidylglycerophosphate synthase